MPQLFGTKRIKGISEAGLGLVPKGESSGQSSQSQTTSEPTKDGKEQYFEDDVEIDKYNHAYNNCGNIQAGIDITSEQAVQDYFFEGPDKEQLKKWADEVNLGIWMEEACRIMLKHGKCYGELIPLKESKSGLKNPLNPNKILPTGTMGMIKAITSITPTHYLQKTFDKIMYWGTNKPDISEFTDAIKAGKIEDIYRFEWKKGLSMIHSSLVLISTKDQMESDLPTITRRYVAPIIDLSVGNENSQPDDDDIDYVKKEVEDIYADTEFVHSYLIEAKVLGFQGKMVDTSPLFGHVDDNIEKGVQCPVSLFLGEKKKAEDSEPSLRSFGRHVKHVQRVLKAHIEDSIIMRMTNNRENKIIWGFAEEREKEMEIDIIRGLVTDGIVTPQKANDLLPDKFREVLPEELKNPAKAMAANAQERGANGMKDRHGKTDPTKSSTAVPGKRITKKDRGVTLKRSA